MAEQQRALGGRYLLKDKVGAGGMASVYRATDTVLDRTVAVKIMLPQYAGDATFAARFKQEAQAAAALQSPYIVGVYDWGKDGDTYYIVMEYLRGTDLKSGIRSHGALDPKKVAQIGSQICSALSVAHRHEIVHRDIKPQNIMVQPDGNIKVMDFGIARAKNSHLTQDNNVLGTAHYVSPEQTRGQELGPTSDIYSLGIVMYECATGRVPFDGDDAISVALKQVNELPVPPSQINPRVDGDLERIILKCMEKDAANRFQSADELRGVLNAYLAGRTVEVSEPTRVITPGAVGMGAGATETRVMSDQTQAMARPAAAGATAQRTPRTASQIDTQSYENGGMSKGKIAAIVAAVIGVVAIALFAVSGLFAPAEQMPIPYVVGKTEDVAKQELMESGFSVEVGEAQFSSEYPEGQVCDQSPDGGKDDSGRDRTADKGSKVTIYLSKGEDTTNDTEVPDLSSCTSKDEAETALKKAGLVLGSVSQDASDAEKGAVIGQDPQAGTAAKKGDKVNITISSGPKGVNVPGVVGKTEAQAIDELSSAGFKVNRQSGGYSDRYGKGVVMSQDPTGKVEEGSTITIYISDGPKPSSPATPDKPDAPSYDVTKVKGMMKAQASAKLQEEGYTISEVVEDYDPSGTFAAGQVMDVQKVSDTEVKLVVSKGAPQ